MRGPDGAESPGEGAIVEAYKQHQAMGFEQGWGIVAGQLAAIAEEMAVAA